jgi:predicted O-methyltransferase YrrM
VAEAPSVEAEIDRLYRVSRLDGLRLLRALPELAWTLLSQRRLSTAVNPHAQRATVLPVKRRVGEFLQVLALGVRAKTIVEYGTSLGVSTLYLAEAARRVGGHVYSTEIVPEKCRAARESLRATGLAPFATVFEGDALVTLQQVSSGVDFVLLDGWKRDYEKIIALLLPHLLPGCVIYADNVNFSETRSYTASMTSATSPFTSVLMFRGKGLLSVFHGAE